ncbi:hypothetical protein MAX14_22435 [Escherichia coli]
MKKGWISFWSGLAIGIILSYFVLNYEGLTIHHVGENSKVTKTINELDYNLITNSFSIIVVSIGLIYLILTVLEKVRKI